MLEIKLFDKNKNIKAQSNGNDQAYIVYKNEYEQGDFIVITPDDINSFYWIQVDASINKSLVYLTGEFTYQVPFDEKKLNISPNAFCGERHLISIKKAKDFEYNIYRNLALNPNDQNGQQNSFPHAIANVETRGEVVFAAQNAIDGVTSNDSHGRWPYASWGINMNDNAQWEIYFGRDVCVDKLCIYLRADFPHDNWWEKATVSFSDGSEMILSLEKGGHEQEFNFDKKIISWVKLSHLIKADDPSPFPALTQFEIYGTEVN